MILHSPTPKYRNAIQIKTGRPIPYTYTNITLMLKSPKSYSNVEPGEERKDEIEEEREDDRYRVKIKVVKVQNGPYKSGGFRCVDRYDVDVGMRVE
jgi:hypothetical protein